MDKFKATHMNLHRIIGYLENPNVRLDDKAEAAKYKVNERTLGILYAQAVDSAPESYSPSLMMQTVRFQSNDIANNFKRRFQLWTRNRMWERIGDLVLRIHTADELANEYLLKLEFTKYPEDSLENSVLNLAAIEDFEGIGKRLKNGAKDYEDFSKAKEREHDNYRIAQEYVKILEAFKI
jgi:hypothetical protein